MEATNEHKPLLVVKKLSWDWVLLTTVGISMYMHNVCHIGGGVLLLMGLGTVLYAMVVWWRDVIREATFEGHHNASPSMAFGSTTGLRYGMLCFIASEVMFFVAFFWALFHSSLAPKVEMGDVWPPSSHSVIRGKNTLKLPVEIRNRVQSR